MYNAAAALKTYFSGFSFPAYTVDSVPDDVVLPYIAYSLNMPEWNQKAANYVQIWDRTTSNTGIIRKADEILKDIGQGRILRFDGGQIVIWPETPQVQIMVDGNFRSAYLNLSINCYSMPGE